MGCLVRHPINRREVTEIFSMFKVCFPRINSKYFAKRILGDSSYTKSNTFILFENNCIVSHAHLFSKKIWWENEKVNFMGLGFVCTMPEFRGRGYATELLRHIVKEKKDYLLGLFTKIPSYYKKFGFKVVPRKQFIIKRGNFRAPQAPRMKIRRFSFDRDISQVINMNKNYFFRQSGIVDRSFKDWKNQLSYFDEEKKLFLVAESRGRIMAYVRCKLKNRMANNVMIVEHASNGKSDGIIRDFISYLFNKLNIDEISGWSHFLKPVLRTTSDFDEEIDSRMMIRFNKLYKEDALRKDELCFLESDGF